MQFTYSDDRNSAKALVFLKYEIYGLILSADFYIPAEFSKELGAYIFRVVFSDYQ
jgi:hypothetical protein